MLLTLPLGTTILGTCVCVCVCTTYNYSMFKLWNYYNETESNDTVVNCSHGYSYSQLQFTMATPLHRDYCSQLTNQNQESYH